MAKVIPAAVMSLDTLTNGCKIPNFPLSLRTIAQVNATDRVHSNQLFSCSQITPRSAPLFGMSCEGKALGSSQSALHCGREAALGQVARKGYSSTYDKVQTSVAARRGVVRARSSAGGGERPYTAVMIVPTGVGAAIGGFAGDALPVARALASTVDRLITHPNVLNGAMLYWPMANVMYAEGYGLDKFASGAWGLQPVHQNRVGLVLDCAIDEDLRLRHLQVADSVRATLGLPVVSYTLTDAPLQVEKWIDDETGTSTGRLGDPESLLRAVDTLIRECQVDAVAVVARFPDDSLDEIEDYRQGQGVDALAGVEAVISHMVVERYQIPCAHAPALAPIPLDPAISPRSSAEEIGHTFLPCVLAGLARAPQFVCPTPLAGRSGSPTVWADDVDCVIVPVDACGGDGTLAFARRRGKRPLIIAVEENSTVLSDTPEKLGIDAIRVANYWEALGVIAAHKAGVDPLSLRMDAIKHIPHVSSPAKLAQPTLSKTIQFVGISGL